MGGENRIIIVGGGVIGLGLARELARSGAGSVTVLDRGLLGREASFAAAGMLAPNAECEDVDEMYRLCSASRAMFPQLAEELLDETGIDIELDRSGTVYAAFSEADARHLDRRFNAQTAAGIRVERLTPHESIEAEPNLSRDMYGSLFFPDDWQVENRKLVAALERYARLNGIEVITQAHCDSVRLEGGRVTGVAAGERRIYGDVIVLATGAWTSFIKIGGEPLPIAEVKPVRGQMISYEPDKRLFNKVIYSPRGYLVPRADGRVLIGATVEDVGFNDQVTDEGVAALRSAADEIAPCLSSMKITESWSGLRPYAADGLPIIGPVPGIENAYVATAHYRNGILLAPITAKLLAEHILNGRDSHYLDIFGPSRSKPEVQNAGT